MIRAPYGHQIQTRDFALKTPAMWNTSDPGTGKTRSHLDAFNQRAGHKRALVLAPLSILESAWRNDAREFTPNLRVSVAYAANRAEAFATNSDIVVTNIDAAKWIADQCKKTKGAFLREFDELIVDECTAFKSHTSQRTKALLDIRHHFQHRRLMTGTPATQSLIDMWSLGYICDDGKRLGENFYRYRDQVCEGKQVGASAHAIRWIDRPGARDVVAASLADITIRFSKNECLDLPPNTHITVMTKLPDKVRRMYDQMAKESYLLLNSGDVSAINAAVRANKLLQICTGAIYDSGKAPHVLHTERYEQVMQLVMERPWACLVAFNWHHERDELCKLAEAAGIAYAVIDGETPAQKRTQIVEQMQRGELKVLFAHPQSAGHGLTLTRAKSVIWSSPTPNAEFFLQFNARIDRAGQTEKTETIMVAAEETRELQIYEMLQGKVDRVGSLLNLFCQLRAA
jgi:SNF2 family DNA or RNA helicase